MSYVSQSSRMVSPQVMSRLNRWAARQPAIVLMGEFSAGKTTLINFLLGEDVLPTRITATQLPPVWISYGPNSAHYVDLEGQKHDIDIQDLATVSVEGVRFIRVFCEAGILKTLSLIDTPGISDPNIPREYSKAAIAQSAGVVWCTHATQAWRESERSAWDALPDRLRENSILLATRSDKLAPANKDRVYARLNRETEDRFKDIVMFSATDAIEAVSSDDPGELWLQSGAPELLKSLQNMAVRIFGKREQFLERYELDPDAPEMPEEDIFEAEVHTFDPFDSGRAPQVRNAADVAESDGIAEEPTQNLFDDHSEGPAPEIVRLDDEFDHGSEMADVSASEPVVVDISSTPDSGSDQNQTRPTSILFNLLDDTPDSEVDEPLLLQDPVDIFSAARDADDDDVVSITDIDTEDEGISPINLRVADETAGDDTPSPNAGFVGDAIDEMFGDDVEDEIEETVRHVVPRRLRHADDDGLKIVPLDIASDAAVDEEAEETDPEIGDALTVLASDLGSAQMPTEDETAEFDDDDFADILAKSEENISFDAEETLGEYSAVQISFAGAREKWRALVEERKPNTVEDLIDTFDDLLGMLENPDGPHPGASKSPSSGQDDAPSEEPEVKSKNKKGGWRLLG